MRKRAPLGVAVAFLLAWLSAPGHAAPLESDRLLSAQSKLAFGLIEELETSGPAGNIMISPASAAAVLSVLDLGADADLRSAIHLTLGFDLRDRARSDLEALRNVVSTLERQGGPVTLANAIVFDPEAAPEPAVVDALRAAGAEASVENLSDPEALQRINDWVSDQTNGLVPSILDEALREPGLMAVNALHFKDEWRVPFDPSATRDGPFHTLGGGTLEVPMMRAEGRFRFRQDAQFVAVDLPYASGGFALTLVSSRQQPLEARGFADAAAWLDGSGFVEGPGEIAMPRFSLEKTADMLSAFDSLGLAPARASPTALSGFSAAAQTISRVVQKTVLQVDEAGTEAAAATAVTTLRSMPDRFVKLTVDKPFMFALRDGQTGLILLAGYVGNPMPGVQAEPAIAPRVGSTRGVVAGGRPEAADALPAYRSGFEVEVEFSFDSSEVSTSALEALRKIGNTLGAESRQGATFEVAGHTDAQGDAGYNQRLSEQRAQAVKDFLVANFDIDAGTLVAVGYAEQRLKNTDDPFAAENRRVEISTASSGRQVGVDGAGLEP